MEDVNEYKIYAYINKINGKMYVGQTCNSLKDRSGKDGKLYNNCTLFRNAIKKYGWDNFIPIILIDGLNKDAADYFEIELIKEFDTVNPNNGYNISKGGADNSSLSVDISGQKFNHLTAIKLVNTNKRGRYWLCRCDCGRKSIVRQDHLRNGTTKACCYCNLGGNTIKQNEIKEYDDYIQVHMTRGSFIIDKNDYEIIKNKRWYNAKNNTILDCQNRKNILHILFPQIKRERSIRYIKFIDNNNFNLRRNNMKIHIPNNVNENDWMSYLSENLLGITYVNRNKPWYCKELCKYFVSYNEAKIEYLKNKGSDINE